MPGSPRASEAPAASLSRREGLPPLYPATGLYEALVTLGLPQPGQRKVAAPAAAGLAAWLPPQHRDAATDLLGHGERLAQEAVGLTHLLRTRNWLDGLE